MFTSMFRRSMLGGGSQVKSIMTDLIAGTGYCDFFVIGDSNAGNYDATGARGYAGGLWDSLAIDNVINEYGTQFAECGSDITTQLKGGAPSSGNYGLAKTVIATTYGNVWSKHYTGTADKTTLLDSIWKRGLLSPGATKEAAYLESTSAEAYTDTWMKFSHNSSVSTALSCQHAATFRLVLVGGINQSTAVVRTWVYAAVSGADASAQANNNVYNATSTPTIQILDKSWSASGTRLEQAATFNANTTATGPVICLMRSVFRSGVPGFAVTNLQNYSGGTTSVIAASLSDATGCGSLTLATYFKQAIERQTTAGATKKRVIVFINMGINDGTATCTANYVTNTNLIIAQCKTAWESAGGVAADLGIICTVSHSSSTFSPTGANAAASSSLVGDPVVHFVNITPTGTSYSDKYGTIDAHLSQAGYRFAVNLAFQAIMT
tara:strand:+ start:1063 stop:2370 length:1308 start_codon:yes stop_codon:yes gene_type:complete